LYPILYEPLIRRALEEDLGRAGDLTSDAVLPPELKGEGRIVARVAGRLAGLPMALAAFRILDPEIEIEVRAADGEDVEAGGEGPAACCPPSARPSIFWGGCLASPRRRGRWCIW
jgi:nicotinate-nucleotide pyrophosphorylase (carboxylating)